MWQSPSTWEWHQQIKIVENVQTRSRLISGNTCYPSVTNLLSSYFLPKNIKMKIYRTIMLPVVWYGYETWSLIFREKHGLKVLDNRIVRKIFEPKREKVAGGWRKLYSEQLHELYSLRSIIWVIKSRRRRLAGHSEYLDNLGSYIIRRYLTLWKVSANVSLLIHIRYSF